MCRPTGQHGQGSKADACSLQGLYNTIINNTQNLTKEDVLSKVVDDFQSTFCTDPVFIPKQKVPASLTGEARPALHACCRGNASCAVACCKARA